MRILFVASLHHPDVLEEARRNAPPGEAARACYELIAPIPRGKMGGLQTCYSGSWGDERGRNQFHRSKSA